MDEQLSALVSQMGAVTAALRARRAQGARLSELESLEWKIDELVARIAQATTGTWSGYSPGQQLAKLRELDPYFREIDQLWSAVVGEAGAMVAAELLNDVNVEERWRTYWHPVGEDALTERNLIATDTATDPDQFGAGDTGARAGVSPLENPVYQQLILDLRYAANQRMAAIAAMFAVSQTAIQGRVAAFEARVADAIAERLLAPQLAADWTLTALPGQRPDDPRLLLLRVGTDPAAPEIALQLLPEWPQRMRHGGRPRDVQRYARADMRRRGPRLWAILVVPDHADPGDEPRLVFVPARGEYGHRVPAGREGRPDQWMLSTSEILTLEEAVRQVLA